MLFDLVTYSVTYNVYFQIFFIVFYKSPRYCVNSKCSVYLFEKYTVWSKDRVLDSRILGMDFLLYFVDVFFGQKEM